jgi:hypothetical protein
LDKAMADLSDDDKKAAEEANNPESETRMGWSEKLTDWTGDIRNIVERDFIDASRGTDYSLISSVGQLIKRVIVAM